MRAQTFVTAWRQERWESGEAEKHWLGGLEQVGQCPSLAFPPPLPLCTLLPPTPLYTPPMINQPYHYTAEARRGRKGYRERRRLEQDGFP